METRIRKCANSKCATVIPASERANKKICSETCKNRAHNEDNKKGKVTWDPYLLGEKGRSKGMVSTATNREFIDNVKSRMIDRMNQSKEELAMPVETEEVNDGE